MPDVANRAEAKLALPPTEMLAGPSKGWGARRIARDMRADALTPSRIHTLLRDAETGDISAQCELFEHMEERDGELGAHLRTRKAGVLKWPWTIEPADDSANAAKAAELCQETIAGIEDVEAALFDLLDAIPKGFSILEIDWRTDKTSWTPVGLVFRPQRHFTLADDGTTLMLRGEGYDEKLPLPDSKFVIHRAHAKSGYEWQTSLLRSCVRAWILRFYGWKDWSAFAEVFGMPPRIGRLPPNTAFNSPEATQLYDAVRHMGTDMAALISAEAQIEFPEIGSRTDHPSEMIIAAAGRELTLAILGQTLTSGGEQGGSYALGQVQNEVRLDLVQSDARSLSRTLTRQLLRPIVLLNLGAGYPVPEWTINVQEPVDLQQRANVVNILADRLPIAAAPIRKEFGLPEPEGDEEVLGQKPLAAPATYSAVPVQRGRRAVARPSPRILEALPDEILNSAAFVTEARRGGLAPARLLEMLNQATPPAAPASAFRRLRPDALSWLREKRVADQSTWDGLSPAGRQRAWWVTGLDEQATARLADMLTEAAANSWTENQFLERIEAAGLAVTGDKEPGEGQIADWQARLVHDQNRWAAYHAANWQQMQETAAERGYVQRMCGGGPCDICSPYCGQVHRLGEIGALFGALHLGCQCEDVSVSQSEVDRESINVLEAPDESAVPEGFRFNRGDAFYLESKGQAPATERGRQDRGILAGRPLPSALIGG